MVFFIVSCMTAQKIWCNSIARQDMYEGKSMRPANHWVIAENKRKIIRVAVREEDFSHSG